MFRSRSHATRLLPLVLVGGCSTVAVASAFAIVAPDFELPNGFLGDFDHNVWDAGRTLLDGRNPVRDESAVAIGGSPYQPIAAVLTLPFALPPYGIAAVLWTLTSIVGVVAALAACGVRDWRCHALALFSPPVISGLAYGNVSVVLVALLAAIWVWRGRAYRVGVILGLALTVKPFVWPLLLWLVLSGRKRSAGIAAATATMASLLGWAYVGFDGLRTYPGVLRKNTNQYLEGGDSMAALVANLGAPRVAIAGVVLATSALLAACAWRRRTDDLMCLTATLALALLASPLVWTHYYVLMLVPLAISAPQLSRAWLFPYLTAPQLTAAANPAENVVDAGSGVALIALTLRHVAQCVPRSAPRPPELASERRSR